MVRWDTYSHAIDDSSAGVGAWRDAAVNRNIALDMI